MKDDNESSFVKRLIISCSIAAILAILFIVGLTFHSLFFMM